MTATTRSHPVDPSVPAKRAGRASPQPRNSRILVGGRPPADGIREEGEERVEVCNEPRYRRSWFQIWKNELLASLISVGGSFKVDGDGTSRAARIGEAMTSLLSVGWSFKVDWGGTSGPAE